MSSTCKPPMSPDELVQRVAADPVDILADDVIEAAASLPELPFARLRLRLSKECPKVKLVDFSKAVAAARARCEDERPKKVEIGWRFNLTTGRGGETEATFANLCTILEHRYEGRLSYDRMSNKPCLDGAPLTDHDITGIRVALSKAEEVSFNKEDIADGVAFVGRNMREFHPIEEYLRGLKHDGELRLDTASTTLLGLPVSDVLSATMVRRTLIAMVARGLAQEAARAPDATEEERAGCKVDTVLVLVARQGAKKSTLFRLLGGRWFGDSKVDIGDRKGTMTMLSKWIYEWPEVDRVVAKHSDSETKAYVSQQSDDFVPMYGRGVISALRCYVVVGTTNKPRFLTDATGNRRWWVLDIRESGPAWKANKKRVLEMRDQLFAEAVAEYDAFKAAQRAGVDDDANPHRWWLNDEEEAERGRRAGEFQVDNAWSETVGKWLAGEAVKCPACSGVGSFHGKDCLTCIQTPGWIKRDELPTHPVDGRAYVTPALVLSKALGVPLERHQAAGPKVADTLTELGWIGAARMTIGGVKVTPYYQPEATPEG